MIGKSARSRVEIARERAEVLIMCWPRRLTSPSPGQIRRIQVRVVTWNLWWRFGPWARRRQAILTALRTCQPDAVGLQEVWACGEENLAGWLGDRLWMPR